MRGARGTEKQVVDSKKIKAAGEVLLAWAATSTYKLRKTEVSHLSLVLSN
jgi:hypothetical protein